MSDGDTGLTFVDLIIVFFFSLFLLCFLSFVIYISDSVFVHFYPCSLVWHVPIKVMSESSEPTLVVLDESDAGNRTL